MDNNEEENHLKALERNERQVTENQRGWEQTRPTKVGASEERFQLAEKVPMLVAFETCLRGRSVRVTALYRLSGSIADGSISPVHKHLYKEAEALSWTWTF